MLGTLNISCLCCRSDEDDREYSNKTFFSSFFDDTSDLDSSSVSARHEFYSSKSVGSSPLDSPCRIHNFNRIGHPVEQEQVGTSRFQNGPSDHETSVVPERPETGTQDPDNTCQKEDDLLTFQDQRPLDLEKNGLIWFPPPAVDENDDKEDNFFAYEDDEDDVGESTALFSSGDLNSMLLEKDKDTDGQKDSLRAVVQGHFRALVSQLLLGEGIQLGKENSEDNWLDVVTAISWQAANFVRPDTSRGGSMDPVDYVKVKCIASGIPSERYTPVFSFYCNIF